MSKKDDPKIVEIEGELRQIGGARKPQKTGSSWSVTVPMKELVKQAILKGMDVADFVLNFQLCFYEVVPKGGDWLRDGYTVLRWERRIVKEKKGEK